MLFLLRKAPATTSRMNTCTRFRCRAAHYRTLISCAYHIPDTTHQAISLVDERDICNTLLLLQRVSRRIGVTDAKTIGAKVLTVRTFVIHSCLYSSTSPPHNNNFTIGVTLHNHSCTRSSISSHHTRVKSPR